MNVYNPYYVLESHDIQHHGVLGQKWGVRRYQNKDGSLTAKGKARYSKDLYDTMKKNDGKLYRYEYNEKISSKLAGDKRVQDYVKNHSKEYKKLFSDWSNAEDKVDEQYEKHFDEMYKRAKKQAISEGGDPNLKHFDDYVCELMSNDKMVSALEEKAHDAFEKLSDYSKTATPLVKDLIGKYGDKPANAINDHDVTAEKWVYSAIEDLLRKYDDEHK